jgi:NTP pyrophosphatase (non-canonical NTP hydrolase)
MSLSDKGLAKLSEECAELIVEAQKKIAFMDTDEHPDNKGSLKERLENEIGDVLAAINVSSRLLNLDLDRISERKSEKIKLFNQWANED